jgi:hypothetical protein
MKNKNKQLEGLIKDKLKQTGVSDSWMKAHLIIDTYENNDKTDAIANSDQYLIGYVEGDLRDPWNDDKDDNYCQYCGDEITKESYHYKCWK